MLQNTDVSRDFVNVAELIDARSFQKARALFNETLANADPRLQRVIVDCAAIVRDPRQKVAEAKIRHYYDRHAGDPEAQAIIAACAPKVAKQPPRSAPNHAPRASSPRLVGKTIDENGTPVRTRRTRPEPNRRPTTGRYVTTTAAVDDNRHRPAPITGDRRDYDRDVVRIPARGCCIALGCNLELSLSDRAKRDGLCSECRELGRPGIELPADLSAPEARAQAIHALAAYFWQHYPQPLKRCRALWHRLNARDKATLAAWVDRHDFTDPAAWRTTLDGADRCQIQTCRSLRHVREVTHPDGSTENLCVDCRNLDTTTIPPLRPAATQSNRRGPSTKELRRAGRVATAAAAESGIPTAESGIPTTAPCEVCGDLDDVRQLTSPDGTTDYFCGVCRRALEISNETYEQLVTVG